MYGIDIPFHPNVFEGFGNLSWHGVFSAVGVLVVVLLAAGPVQRVLQREQLSVAMFSNMSIVAIIGGGIGARLVHVVDTWDRYQDNLLGVFAIWNGGIGLWGAILGAIAALLIYGRVRKIKGSAIGGILDAIAIPMLIGQSVGRLGDFINGEHCATVTKLPWGHRYTNPDSNGYNCVSSNNLRYDDSPAGAVNPADISVHPATEYEIIWNLIGVVVIYLLRGRLAPAGAIVTLYLFWYALGRFLIQWIRLDTSYFLGLQVAHLIAIAVMFAALMFAISKIRWVKRSN